MEHTSGENAKTESLQRLDEMVTVVKRDGKVELAYMKSFEIEEWIQKEEHAEGLAQGITQGKTDDILAFLSDLGDISTFLRERVTA